MIKLYQLETCPFCIKVREKLDELGLEYETVEVSWKTSERDEVEEISGQRQVPVIVDEEHGVDGMNESSDIIEYLEETYG
ncbi:MAG: glutathione S-transferase N-terminal domain-containing protein [Halobacteria archaeon]|nr:glutathione S-transferase N-terminal domain-containing protein [Halobacteria archaeon]